MPKNYVSGPVPVNHKISPAIRIGFYLLLFGKMSGVLKNLINLEVLVFQRNLKEVYAVE